MNRSDDSSQGRQQLRPRSQSSTGRPGRFQRNRLSRAQGEAAMSHAASTTALDAVAGLRRSWTSFQTPSQAQPQPHRQARALPPSSGPSSSQSAPGFFNGDVVADESDSSDTESVLSEYDLVNDAIQEYLLASDNSDSDSDFSGDFGDGTTTLYISALLPAVSLSGSSSSDPASRRRRMAKKAGSSTALASSTTARHQSRMHGSLSTGSLLALDAEADFAGVERRQLKTRRRVARLNTGRSDVRGGGGSGSKGPLYDQEPPLPRQQQRTALLRPLKPVHRGVPVGPLSVVLDIDETLVYAREGVVHVRPFVKALLDTCTELRCEIIVWTAGVASYVNPILHAIADVCHRKAWFHHIISRHRRWYGEGCKSEASGVKDLALLGRPLERVLLIENNPVSVYRQPRNAILVEDYLQPSERDDTLLTVAGIVRRAVCCMGGAAGPTCSASSPDLAAVLSPALPLADFLDGESAVGYATFELDHADVSSQSDEERDTGPRPCRQLKSAMAEEVFGPQLPDTFGSQQNDEEVGGNGNEEEDVSSHHVRRQTHTSKPLVASWAPTMDEASAAAAAAKARRTVRCRVLQQSPSAPFMTARSYGCLAPLPN